MPMKLDLSDDERTSIAYYLTTMNFPGLVDLGAFILRLEGSDEISRLIHDELKGRPEALPSLSTLRALGKIKPRASGPLDDLSRVRGPRPEGSPFLDEIGGDHYDPSPRPLGEALGGKGCASGADPKGIDAYEAMVKRGIDPGTPPDLADEPEAERDANRELDEKWDDLDKLDDEPPFPHWKDHGAGADEIDRDQSRWLDERNDRVARDGRD
jgi:hypothetical protein